MRAAAIVLGRRRGACAIILLLGHLLFRRWTCISSLHFVVKGDQKPLGLALSGVGVLAHESESHT
jgi:hypothetical protein